MKKILLLVLLFSGYIQAQIVNIPDANFKAKLLAADVTNGIAKNQALQNIKIDSNNDGEIQLSEAILIYRLDVQNSNISDLTGIQSFTTLDRLYCDQNQLTTLNLQGLTNLKRLDCELNELTSQNLIISDLINLEFLDCSYNQLTSLDLNGFSSLEEVYCRNNNLTSLEVETLSNLVVLGCEFNQLTSLNVEALYYLDYLWCHDNELIYLNVKNGNQFWFSEFLIWNNPNLQFLCVNEENILIGQAYINDNGYTNCVVSSYCSFFPGGNYNIITGTTTFDSNNNGCDTSDLPQPFVRININDGTNQGAAFTNGNGAYNFFTQAGSFDITPNIENPTFFNFLPATATIPFADNNNNTSIQDFCITPNGIHPDLEIVIAPINPARPGFEAVYKIVYRNIGNQTLSGNIIYTFNDAILDYVTASIAPTTISYSEITWNYTDLIPFESRNIVVRLNVNSPIETPAVNIGDVLINNVLINPVNNDENVSDNAFTLNQTVVGSYDPNDISCLQGDVVSPSEIGNYLHYLIRFENTGNAPAENVVVKVEIDPTQFDSNSLQMLSTSHDANIRMTGNKIEFIFENIQLESGGHGNILLKMKTNETLQIGDYVEKRANIYFDYNFPIETNEAETLFQSLRLVNPILDNLISIYPNPVKDIVNISIKDNSTIKTIELYDVQGRLLQTQVVNDIASQINIAERANGMYFIKINTDKGSKVEKLIKE